MLLVDQVHNNVIEVGPDLLSLFVCIKGLLCVFKLHVEQRDQELSGLNKEEQDLFLATPHQKTVTLVEWKLVVFKKFDIFFVRLGVSVIQSFSFESYPFKHFYFVLN